MNNAAINRDDYYLLVIINCGCIDESALASVCRTYVVPARVLRLRLMGVPTCDPLGLATLATVASAAAASAFRRRSLAATTPGPGRRTLSPGPWALLRGRGWAE